jgi:hypothetical protein
MEPSQELLLSSVVAEATSQSLAENGNEALAWPNTPKMAYACRKPYPR